MVGSELDLTLLLPFQHSSLETRRERAIRDGSKGERDSLVLIKFKETEGYKNNFGWPQSHRELKQQVSNHGPYDTEKQKQLLKKEVRRQDSCKKTKGSWGPTASVWSGTGRRLQFNKATKTSAKADKIFINDNEGSSTPEGTPITNLIL